MTKKNFKANEANVKQNIESQEVVNEATQVEETQATKQNSELEAAKAKLEELKKQQAEMRAKLEELKAKQKLESGRPVRLCEFSVYCIDSEATKGLIDDGDAKGEFVVKSDVHYKSEKAAIDMAKGRITDDKVDTSYTYLLYKVNKKTGNALLVSKIYIDESTKQVVIE